jgi:hypothetical protein
MTSLRSAFVVVVLTLAAAGCGRGSAFAPNKGDEPNVKLPPPAPQTPRGLPPGESFGMTYTISFSGPMPLSGTFSERVSSRLYKDCMDYLGRRNEGTFEFEGKTGGHDVRFAVEVAIKAAGTFTPEPDSVVNLVFDDDNSRWQFSGFAKTYPVKVVVNADASGTVTFSNWKNDSGESESGTASWVCTK